MEFYTMLKRPVKKDFLEINEGETIVEPKGVLSVKQMVENLIDAGVNLHNYRMANYDIEVGSEDDEIGYATAMPADTADALMQQKIALENSVVSEVNNGIEEQNADTDISNEVEGSEVQGEEEKNN